MENAIGIYGDAGAEIKDGMAIPIPKPKRTTKIEYELFNEETQEYEVVSRPWNPDKDETSFAAKELAYDRALKERAKDHGNLWNFLRATVGSEILTIVDSHPSFLEWMNMNDTLSYYKELVSTATTAASRQGETLKNKLVNRVKQVPTDNCEQFLTSYMKLIDLIGAAKVELAEKHAVKTLQLAMIQSQFLGCPEFASIVPHEWQSSKFPEITLVDLRNALLSWYQGTVELEPNFPKYDEGGCSIDRLIRGEFDGPLVIHTPGGVGSDGKVARAFSTVMSNQVAMSNPITRDMVINNAYANSAASNGGGGGGGGGGGAKLPNPQAAAQARLAEQYYAHKATMSGHSSNSNNAECQNCGGRTRTHFR